MGAASFSLSKLLAAATLSAAVGAAAADTGQPSKRTQDPEHYRRTAQVTMGNVQNFSGGQALNLLDTVIENLVEAGITDIPGPGFTKIGTTQKAFDCLLQDNYQAAKAEYPDVPRILGHLELSYLNQYIVKTENIQILTTQHCNPK